MAINQKRNLVYVNGSGYIALAPVPIVAKRPPTNADIAEVGTSWIDEPNDDTYVLTSITAGLPVWTASSGGAGTFTAVTATTGDITATLGDIVATAGGLEGETLTIGTFTAGALLSSAAGVISSTPGTDGQILCGSTGLVPSWTSITSASLVLTPGAGTLNIEESGGTANSFITDLGGPVVPLVGVTSFLGGANITTDGTVANTITFGLDDNVTIVGAMVVGDSLEMLQGTCTLEADDDIANAIYLHTDGGTNETITLYSQQGTSVASITLLSDLGGIALASGLATANAVTLVASDAAGGLTAEVGTGGFTIDSTNGVFLVETGTGNIGIGTDAFAKTTTISNATGASSVVVDCGTGNALFATSATAHDTVIGSTTGASSLTLQAGTGDLICTSTDDITIDGAGVVEVNSTAGNISIANDADNFNLNLGTAGVRVATLGSATGASSTVVDCGTTGATFGASANAHTTTLGSTNTTSNTILQSGSNGVAITSTGVIDVDTSGIVSINSTGAALNLGNDADDFAVNIATAGARVVTLGNITGATQVVVNSGTAGINLVSTGAGDITAAAGDALLLDAVGVVEVNSSGAAIGIASDADDFALNLGILGNRSITMGVVGGTTDISLDAGAGIDINSAGLVTVTPATDSFAGAAVTIDANVGVGTFTGLVTAAAASQVLTITNSVCTVGSAILCTLANLGANDAQCCVTRVIPAAGSFTVTYQNLGAAALNGDIILTFWIIAA